MNAARFVDRAWWGFWSAMLFTSGIARLLSGGQGWDAVDWVRDFGLESAWGWISWLESLAGVAIGLALRGRWRSIIGGGTALLFCAIHLVYYGGRGTRCGCLGEDFLGSEWYISIASATVALAITELLFKDITVAQQQTQRNMRLAGALALGVTAAWGFSSQATFTVTERIEAKLIDLAIDLEGTIVLVVDGGCDHCKEATMRPMQQARVLLRREDDQNASSVDAWAREACAEVEVVEDEIWWHLVKGAPPTEYVIQNGRWFTAHDGPLRAR